MRIPPSQWPRVGLETAKIDDFLKKHIQSINLVLFLMALTEWFSVLGRFITISENGVFHLLYENIINNYEMLFHMKNQFSNYKNSNMKTTLLKSFFVNSKYRINSLTTNVPHHKETSPLTCSTNQLTGFYMMGNTGR